MKYFLFLANDYHMDDEERFCCQKCGKHFKRKNGYNQHCKYKRCSNTMKFECEICHKIFVGKISGIHMCLVFIKYII